MKRTALCVVGTLTLLAACSGGNEEPELGEVKPLTSAADIVLPLEAYMFDAEEDAVTQRANNQLVRACGKRFGIEVTMPVAVNPPPEIVLARR
ncbi:MAG: hypothetical protein ACRDVZ_17335 [Jiangellaceae bacterium]